MCDGDLPGLVALAIEAERWLQSPMRSLDDSMADHIDEAESSGGDVSSGGGTSQISEHVFVWPVCHQVECSPIVYHAIEQQAGYFDATLLEHSKTFAPIQQAKPASAWTAELHQAYQETQVLVSAAYAAISMGVGRIVWPKHFHSDTTTLASQLEQIACAVDRALLISRLIHLDSTTTHVFAADTGKDDVQDMDRADHIDIATPFVDLTSEQLAELAVDMHVPIYLAWWMLNKSPSASHERVGMVEHKTTSTAQKLKKHWYSWLNRVGWTGANNTSVHTMTQEKRS